jgi:DNA-binding Lrp family transcriptional regulator
MVVSIALVKAIPGKEKPVYHALKNTDGVRRLYHIFGDHDFLLLLEAESKGGLAQIVELMMKINGIASVDIVLMGREGYLEEKRYFEAPVCLAGLI